MRLLDLVGAGPLPDLPGVAAVIVPLLGLFELRRVVRTLTLVSRRRQRRLVYRFEGDAPADCYSSDGHVSGRLIDASSAGVGLVTEAPFAIGARPAVHLELRGADEQTHEIAAQVEVRSCRPSDERYLVGATIVDIDDDSRMRLMEWCYVVCTHDRRRGHRPSAAPPEVEPIVIQLGDEEPALALAG
jgi:hypothetical protein